MLWPAQHAAARGGCRAGHRISTPLAAASSNAFSSPLLLPRDALRGRHSVARPAAQPKEGVGGGRGGCGGGHRAPAHRGGFDYGCGKPPRASSLAAGAAGPWQGSADSLCGPWRGRGAGRRAAHQSKRPLQRFIWPRRAGITGGCAAPRGHEDAAGRCRASPEKEWGRGVWRAGRGAGPAPCGTSALGKVRTSALLPPTRAQQDFRAPPAAGILTYGIVLSRLKRDAEAPRTNSAVLHALSVWPHARRPRGFTGRHRRSLKGRESTANLQKLPGRLCKRVLGSTSWTPDDPVAAQAPH
jgi:hypothetical protein